jgi:hypothetical protein
MYEAVNYTIGADCRGRDGVNWPKALLAAKTYANDPLKSALSVGFCTFAGGSSVSPETMRRCMK